MLKNLSQTLSVLVLIESCWKVSLSVVTKLLKHHSQTLSVVVIIECWKIKLWVVVVVIESC